MKRLVDIGANLTHESFDHDRAEVLARAAAAGVTRLIITGSTVDDSRKALELARTAPGHLYATAGVHPHHASSYDHEARPLLEEMLQEDFVVAVGECGLDYFRDFSPRPLQQKAFRSQLETAVATGKPLFLHQREAHEDFLAILREYQPELTGGGVAHCFTGTRKQMESYLELGLYIGITGWICDEARGGDLRAAVPALPLDRVMIETDAPYLLPRQLGKSTRNRRNEPANLPLVAETLASHMNVAVEELIAAATRNTENLFGLSASIPD